MTAMTDHRTAALTPTPETFVSLGVSFIIEQVGSGDYTFHSYHRSIGRVITRPDFPNVADSIKEAMARARQECLDGQLLEVRRVEAPYMVRWIRP